MLAAVQRVLRAYYRHLGRRTMPAIPTTVIGSVHAGGVGKTPLTLWFVEQALSQPVTPIASLRNARLGRVGVLLRGYGRRTRGPLWVSRGAGPIVEWQDSGDEAWLIAKRLPQAHVLVCEDRVRGAEILQESGVQEIICDDGFQHFRLQPSRSLVLLPEDMSAKDLHSLPFGTLREDLSAIQHAGEVWIPAASFVFWSEILDRRGINVPRYVFRREITTFTVGTRVLSKEECAARLGNEEVHVVTALARPQHFTRALGELLPRARIYKHQFGDHQAIALERLTSLRGVIVMTEKDAVKTVWSPEFEFLSERVYVAREEVRA